MAAADVLSRPPQPMATFRPIIENATVRKKLSNMVFDPDRDLDFQEPESIIKMTDIGYRDDTGISPVAVSQPFRLFSTEAIQKFRDEVLSSDVMAKHCVKSNIAACQLRGYAPRYAPFTYDAFHNEETLSIISKIAGVDLIPQMDYEIGHVNISVKSDKQAEEELAAVQREKQRRNAFDDVQCPWQDDKPIVGWHTDSYPFVCVVMLSDCTNMVGGETAMRTADGSIIVKVRGPTMGCAVVMQGRYITHQALRALGTQERITLVTSLRPKSPLLPDDSDLHTVRGISNVPELHYQYAKYRLEILEARIKDRLVKLEEDHRRGEKTDTMALKQFLDEQEQFLNRTNTEIWLDDEVVVGRQPELEIPDATVDATNDDDGPSPTKRSKAS